MIQLFLFSLTMCYTPQYNGVAVYLKSDSREKICFYNIDENLFQQCEDTEYFPLWSNLPKNGVYKYFWEKKEQNKDFIDKFKEFDDIWDDNLRQEIRLKLNNRTCDDNYLFSDPHGIIPIFSRNSKYEFVYEVLYKNDFEISDHPHNVTRKLCGIKDNKCETIYSDNFTKFYSGAEGKFILLLKENERVNNTLDSFDPVSKTKSNLFVSKKDINIFPLNLYQSIIFTENMNIYIYDHNKNIKKLIYIFPDELKNNFITQIVSIKNKNIIVRLNDNNKNKQKFLIFDFQKKGNPIIKIINIRNDDKIYDMRTYEEPFVYYM